MHMLCPECQIGRHEVLKEFPIKMHEWAQDMEANLSQESQNLLVEEYDRMQDEAFRRIDAVADEGEDNDSLEYFRFEIKGLFGIMDLLVQTACRAGEFPFPEETEEPGIPPELEDPEESEDPEEPDELGEPEKTKEPEALSFASLSSASTD